METLNNLESFVRSAEAGSFSAAARQLGLSPAAVSKNVARLEASLGVLLFQRSTRRLTLTEAGERFLLEVSDGLNSIQAAVANLAGAAGQPAGVLRISLPMALGCEHILPLLPAFRERYPAIAPELHFDNRQVDLIGEGFDAAIGGGIELTPGLVARELMPLHVVALASPAFLREHSRPSSLAELAALPGVAMRSTQSGRLRNWTMRHRAGGDEIIAAVRPDVVVNDPEALCRCASLGLGVAMASLTQAAPYIERGDLVRLLPEWHADLGAVSLYFPGQRLLPAKTRAFVDFVVDAMRKQGVARRFAA